MISFQRQSVLLGFLAIAEATSSKSKQAKSSKSPKEISETACGKEFTLIEMPTFIEQTWSPPQRGAQGAPTRFDNETLPGSMTPLHDAGGYDTFQDDIFLFEEMYGVLTSPPYGDIGQPVYKITENVGFHNGIINFINNQTKGAGFGVDPIAPTTSLTNIMIDHPTLGTGEISVQGFSPNSALGELMVIGGKGDFRGAYGTATAATIVSELDQSLTPFSPNFVGGVILNEMGDVLNTLKIGFALHFDFDCV